MPSAFAFARVAAVVIVLGAPALAQQPEAALSPANALVQKVWHLGRVTGDLQRVIAFYHDVLGLDLRGARSPIPFYSVPAINEFVNAPAHAEFRAAFLPIQGASAETAPADQIYLEAFEYRNIDRRQILPPPPACACWCVISIAWWTRRRPRTPASSRRAGCRLRSRRPPGSPAAPARSWFAIRTAIPSS